MDLILFHFSFRHEISNIHKKYSLRSGFLGLEYTSAPMAVLVSIVTLVLTDHPLTPANVFVLVSFVNLLSLSICFNLSYMLLHAYDACASLCRIEEFLLLENLDKHDMTNDVEKTRQNQRTLRRIVRIIQMLLWTGIRPCACQG